VLDTVGALVLDAVGALVLDAVGALALDAVGALARDAEAAEQHLLCQIPTGYGEELPPWRLAIQRQGFLNRQSNDIHN
jgi:hypothetical protein